MSESATADATAASAAPIAPVLFKARGRGKAKANMRKRSPSPPPARASDSDSNSDSDNDSDDSSRGASGLREAKRRRRNGAGLISASSGGGATANAGQDQPQHFTDRKTLLADSEAATKRSHMFDDDDGNKPKKGASAAGPTPGSTVGAPAPRSVGPMKAPSNIRTITITDFSPDVCTDYKKTGFCGFGDNCKFLHAREDYKAGWQLDNEWEAVTKGKKNLGGTIVASANRSKMDSKDDDEDDEEEAMLRDIPFACIICRESYKQPVITRCGHYFCERCALDRYRRDPTCAACGSATNGVFNNARKLTKLLERKRERAAKRRQAAIEAGEEVSSDEEEGASQDSD